MKKPLPHQKAALKAVDQGFLESLRGQVLMASGTGKTLVAWWAAQKHAKNSILALVPSLALARQLYNDWRSPDVWQNGSKYRWLVVCSDPSVTQNKNVSDDISYSELKAEIKDVTNNASEVQTFLASSDTRPLVVISTYQSAPTLANGFPNKFRFDVSIFDEAHKTAGAAGKLFSFALQDKNLRSKKRLFFTATPRRSSYRTRRGEHLQIFHMGNPKIYGKVFYDLPYMAALKQGLVSDYDVLIPVIERPEVTRGKILSKENTALLAKVTVVAKAAREYNIKKIFSFHGTNVDAELARNFYSETAKGFAVHRVSGRQSSAERANVLQRFAAGRRSIVTNARCLGEGVNIPVCDAVAFMTPRRSKVDIVQAVGRACRIDRRVGATKKKAYVIVPIFIDKGETLEQATAGSAFKDALDTLHVLREHNTALSDEIQFMREYMRKPEAPGPLKVDATRIKILANETLQGGIAGLSVEAFEEAFRITLSQELRATPEEKIRKILKIAAEQAKLLGRI